VTRISPETLASIPIPVIEAAIAAKKAESAQRARWLAEPLLFVKDKLGDHLWSKQRIVLEAIRDHRKVAVQSAHNVGKSFTAADAAAWWLEAHEPGQAFVLTTAPTAPQVKTVLWRYIRRAHTRGSLRGRVNQTEWYDTPPGAIEEMIALGRKPSDLDPSAFQGIHAPYVLVVLDEAGGLASALIDAAIGIASNENSRILAIGNPDDPTARFEKMCRPDSGWHVERISVFDSPNFTGEPVPPALALDLVGPSYVETAKKEWGETSPMYTAKVLGLFPESREDALIPMAWIRRAQDRGRELAWPAPIERPESDEGKALLAVRAGWPHELGGDVGGGHDKSTVYERLGQFARLVHEHSSPDTMVTCGRMIAALLETGATRIKVDTIGIGHGVVDRGRELLRPFVGVNVAESAPDTDRYLNLRAFGYWGLRQRFQDNEIIIDPSDEVLAAQLSNIRYTSNSKGQTVIESKIDMKKRSLPSPDRADALMLAFLPYEADGGAITYGMPQGIERSEPGPRTYNFSN